MENMASEFFRLEMRGRMEGNFVICYGSGFSFQLLNSSNMITNVILHHYRAIFYAFEVDVSCMVWCVVRELVVR